MKINRILFVSTLTLALFADAKNLPADIVYEISQDFGRVQVAGQLTVSGTGIISSNSIVGDGSILDSFSLTFTDTTALYAPITITENSVGAGILIVGAATLEATTSQLIINTPFTGVGVFEFNDVKIGTVFRDPPFDQQIHPNAEISATAFSNPFAPTANYVAAFRPAFDNIPGSGESALGIGTFSSSIVLGNASAVPEPSSLLLTSLIAFGYAVKRRRAREK